MKTGGPSFDEYLSKYIAALHAGGSSSGGHLQLAGSPRGNTIQKVHCKSPLAAYGARAQRRRANQRYNVRESQNSIDQNQKGISNSVSPLARQ